MSWRSAADTIEFWGCINTEYAYHSCTLDTYYDGFEYPDEIKIRLRKWDAVFENGPVMYIKFKYDGYFMKLWHKD